MKNPSFSFLIGKKWKFVRRIWTEKSKIWQGDSGMCM